VGKSFWFFTPLSLLVTFLFTAIGSSLAIASLPSSGHSRILPFKPTLDESYQTLNAHARIENTNHLLDAQPGLLTRLGQLLDSSP
jgi:hypothetical protein